MPFPIAGIALNLGNVLLFLLGNNINTNGREVATLSPSSTAPGILLVVLVFFIALTLIGLALIGGLSIRHVNRERISGFSPSKVFFLLFSGLVLSGTL